MSTIEHTPNPAGQFLAELDYVLDLVDGGLVRRLEALAASLPGHRRDREQVRAALLARFNLVESRYVGPRLRESVEVAADSDAVADAVANLYEQLSRGQK